METEATFNVPDFGTVIEREHLLHVFKGERPGLTLLIAPAGYGKSVVAAQMAASGCFEEALWVTALDEDAGADRSLVSVARALASHVDAEAALSSGAASALSKEDALLAIGEALRTRGRRSICVVIDGYRRLSELSSLQELASLLRRSMSASSGVVVTCRNVEAAEGLDLSRSWIIDEHDLRFSEIETQRLRALVGRSLEQDMLASQLIQRFRGHPALTSLMLRHAGLDEEVTPPKDLVWYVDRLSAGLSTPALSIAYVLALLRQDTAAAVHGCLDETPPGDVWEELASLSPLLLLTQGSSTEFRSFRVHAVLRDAIYRMASLRLGSEVAAQRRHKVLQYLHSLRDYARLHAVLRSVCTEEEVVHWCEQCGPHLLKGVGVESTLQLLTGLSPSVLSGNPRLLLLRANTFREQERFDDARTSALLAASIAETKGDNALWATSSLLVARIGLDTGDIEAAARALGELEAGRGERLDAGSERLLNAYMAVVESQCGDIGSALLRSAEMLKSVDLIDHLGTDEAIFTVNCLAAVEGLCSGRWSTAARLMSSVAKRDDLSASQRVLVRGNLAACQLELGSLGEAKTLLDEVIDSTEAAGLQQMAAHAYGTRSNVRYALGDHKGGLMDYEACERLLAPLGHDYVRLGEQLNASLNRRAMGYREEALALAEGVQLASQHMSSTFLHINCMADLEVAASLLSLGDVWTAGRIAGRSRADAVSAQARSHLLRADLTLAEIERVEDDPAAAVSRLAAHAEYIMTGSANWLTAMYVRAFPGLLGPLTKAVGAESLPLRMLLMLPLETLDEALELAVPLLSEQEASVLRRRRGNESLQAAEEEAKEQPPVKLAHACYARLFGGLEVTTEAGTVDEEGWRKRKARLLFLILLLKQHQDVPRDVLLERLWPDMDEEHAKRNFYVTWSTMKRALACGRAPAEAKQLVQCTGGVCRVTRQVRTDLDDFDEALTALRSATASSDADAAISAARRLVDIYRGELLPGDVYEEWFSEVRERAKHDFCDAMMAAAALAESRSEPDVALLFLRKASAADPWREDVYQATMRCQMNSGQRSRAIETYLSCRSRLTEDLGIDPSIETTRLYQAVLAMEDVG